MMIYDINCPRCRTKITLFVMQNNKIPIPNKVEILTEISLIEGKIIYDRLDKI